MKPAWMAATVVALIFLAGTAGAQTSPTPPPSPGGAFDQLSPGNQKIANAIFQAQQPTATSKPYSLDQIAAMKQGNGWGVIYQNLRSQGLVQGNLGQAVSQFNHETKGAGSAPVEITTASGKTQTVGGSGRSDAAQGARRGSSGDADRPDAGTASGAGNGAAAGHGADAGASGARAGGSHGIGRGK